MKLSCRQDTVATSTVNSQQLQMLVLGLHKNRPNSNKTQKTEKLRGLHPSAARGIATDSLMERGCMDDWGRKETKVRVPLTSLPRVPDRVVELFLYSTYPGVREER